MACGFLSEALKSDFGASNAGGVGISLCDNQRDSIINMGFSYV